MSRAGTPHPDARAAVEAVWRMEAARIVAGLVRLLGDLGDAEDLAQDALVAALERWPETGVPDNPGAWLMATARNRALDRLRRSATFRRKEGQISQEIEAARSPGGDPIARLDDVLGDDLLRLIFICCHPVLSPDARVALTLRVVAGLSTDEIARAFLVPVPTLQQRIVRAKRTLREARVPFELPPPQDLSPRLASVLEVVYLVFNEGYAATAGDDWTRPELCHDALRLGRILAGLAPAEPEVHGLVALMEIQASRLRARVGPGGEPVLLPDQDRARWDPLLIRRGLDALERARGLNRLPGPYVLQAEIAACHARARTADETDWPRIAALYDALAQLSPSPVIELNRAVAVAMAYGADAGLQVLDPLVDDPALRGYHLLPAVRADLLERLGRRAEARAAFRQAADLAGNARERALMLRRAAACEP